MPRHRMRPATAHIRPAAAADAPAVAAVYLAARHGGVPAIPVLVHDDDDVRHHIRDVVLTTQDVAIAHTAGSDVVGFIATSPGWIEHLYVAPPHTGAGVGSALLRWAKDRQPQLDLWTFQSNHGARRFYARHGFVEVDRTDGDNEERAPDVRLRWSRSP